MTINFKLRTFSRILNIKILHFTVVCAQGLIAKDRTGTVL